MAANFSLKPEYYPFVMFHVSWCKHCQHTLPEFEMAARMVEKAKEEGQLKGLATHVKFFMLQCDKSIEERKICDKHPGAGIPMLKLFRDQRELSFTGERWAKTIAEWSVHVSRPMLLQVEANKDLDKYKDLGVLFLMKDEAAKDTEILRSWMEIAFEHIEDCYFSIVPEGSEVARSMPSGLSVSARGKDIEVLEFKGSLKKEKKLREWVNFNQWPVVVELTPEKAVKLMKSGYTVIVYAYKYSRGLSLDTMDPEYRKKASDMRRSGKYIFASIDTSQRENANFMSRVVGAVSVPSIFILPGNITYQSHIMYWEDPTLRTASGLSDERIQAMMLDSWARHDNTTISWAKGWGKWSYRFGTGSVGGFVIMIFIPLAVSCMCFFCIRELMQSDDHFEEELRQVTQDRRFHHCKACAKQWKAQDTHGRICPYCRRPLSMGLLPFEKIDKEDKPLPKDINDVHPEGLKERLSQKDSTKDIVEAKENLDDNCRDTDSLKKD